MTENPVDHLALASEWAMVADGLARNSTFADDVEAREMSYYMALAGLHAQIAAVQAAQRQADSVRQQVNIQNEMVTVLRTPQGDTGEGLFEPLFEEPGK